MTTEERFKYFTNNPKGKKLFIAYLKVIEYGSDIAATSKKAEGNKMSINPYALTTIDSLPFKPPQGFETKTAKVPSFDAIETLKTFSSSLN